MHKDLYEIYAHVHVHNVCTCIPHPIETSSFIVVPVEAHMCHDVCHRRFTRSSLGRGGFLLDPTQFLSSIRSQRLPFHTADSLVRSSNSIVFLVRNPCPAPVLAFYS